MESTDQSFFLDAISDESTQSLMEEWVEIPESYNSEGEGGTAELSSNASITGSSNVAIEPTEMPENTDYSQAKVIFVVGEHRFSDSCDLGVLIKHHEALQAITSNQCLSTSAFLRPALYAAMAELRPSMMVQVAVRLTAITLRLAAKILPSQLAVS